MAFRIGVSSPLMRAIGERRHVVVDDVAGYSTATSSIPPFTIWASNVPSFSASAR